MDNFSKSANYSKNFETREKDKEINLLFKQIENLNDQLADQSDENAQLESDLESARNQLDEKIKEISDLMKIIEGRVLPYVFIRLIIKFIFSRVILDFVLPLSNLER